MLSKQRRLRAIEVREVLKRGRSAHADLLSIKYLSVPTPLRTAAVVSKAVAKRAVDRNRLRRALYRALTPFSGHGTVIVFVQKKPSGPLTPAFAAELAILLKKI